MDKQEPASTQPVPTQATTPSTPESKKPNTCLIVGIILVIVFALLAAGGFLLYRTGTSFVKKAVSTATLNPNCKYNDPDLCKFLNNWKTIKYYTVNSTSTFEGKEQKSIMKSVGTDRFQMTNITGGSENFNMISIANTTYTKDYTDNKWLKTTYEAGSEDQTVDEIKDSLDYDTEEDQTEYKKIGEETCGKYTCLKYQVIDPSAADQSSKEYILFDNSQYLLRKTITEGPDNNLAISEFDYSKISIEEPSPVKETFSLSPTATDSSSRLNSSQAPGDTENALSNLSDSSDQLEDTETPTAPAVPPEPADELF